MKQPIHVKTVSRVDRTPSDRVKGYRYDPVVPSKRVLGVAVTGVRARSRRDRHSDHSERWSHVFRWREKKIRADISRLNEILATCPSFARAIQPPFNGPRFELKTLCARRIRSRDDIPFGITSLRSDQFVLHAYVTK
jgi:hypothetical protein